MPITLKQNMLKFRGSSSEPYRAVDVLAERATSEEIAAIQAKGTEVLNSIPSDYTQLSTDVTNLKGAVNTIDGNMADAYNPLSSYAVGDYCIKDNALYKCNTPIGSGGEAWTAAHWTAVRITDELGSGSGADIDLGITGASVGQFVKVKTVDQDGKPTAWETDDLMFTLTVTCVTQDSVAVTGQIVTLRKGGPVGPIFDTASYNGQSVSFALPYGFDYYVSVSDTLASHFNPTTASGVINGSDVSVTLTYSDFSSIRTAADIKAALDNDIDLTALVGEQITCTKGNSTLTWDVVDYDSTNKVVTILLHDTLPDQMVFEPAQALAWFENGLAAGNYCFTSGANTYYFALAQAIPAGGQLRATTSSFQTYESQAATVTIETGTVSTEEISGATSLGTVGSETGTYPLNHMDRVNYGSNNYAESGLFQWLNSDAAANTQLTRINKFSRPYSVAQAGFLSGLDASFLASIDNAVWKCSANNVYEAPASMGGVTTKQNPYTVTAKVGLASEKEIFGSYGGTDDGSTVFDLFVGASASDRIKYYNNSARNWWLRSPHWNSAYYERYVLTNGSAHSSHAFGSSGVVPACKISKSV